MQSMSRAEYVRALRPELPADLFAPRKTLLFVLAGHVALVVGALGAVARGWVPPVAFPLVSLLVGASFASCTFIGHEALHGAIVRDGRVRHVVGWIGFLPFAISPRLWNVWHNRVHHGHTNQPGVDPDTYPSLAIYDADRGVRFVTDHFAPGRRRIAGLASLLVGFSVQAASVLARPRAIGLDPREHRLAVAETGAGVLAWAAVAWLVGPVAFLVAVIAPMVVANAIVMAFIFTNHSLSPQTDENDPLLNSLSVTLPRWLETATHHFGSHVEHHLFPGMGSRHAPAVRAMLRARWPERYQSLPLGRALLRLHRSPRVYQSSAVLVDPTTAGSEQRALGSAA